MDIAKYEELTGTTVPAAKQTFFLAQIKRTQRILESMLGFTLDSALFNDNEYIELGKTKTECPCPDDNLELDPADDVVFAYRLFPYNQKDAYLAIDPATSIHKVKLVKDGVTYRTLDADEYRGEVKQGLIKFLQQIRCWCTNLTCGCSQMQLAVDATWVWDEGEIPDDLMQIWADMVTAYTDMKANIKSETLGSHSYTKFDNSYPEDYPENIAVITKYAGPHASLRRTITL